MRADRVTLLLAVLFTPCYCCCWHLKSAQRRRERALASFQPPSLDERPVEQLERIRAVVEPAFYSTDAHGRKHPGLGALPRMEGPLLVVGNHQLYGFLDQPLLVEQVWKETGTLLRSLSHRDSFREGSNVPDEEAVHDDEGSGSERGAECGADSATADSDNSSGGWLLSVDAERFGSVAVSPRALYTLMSLGQPTLLYPGGMREALKSTKAGAGECYRLEGWPEPHELDFARLAARFNATIVTVAAVGAEESFAMLLDRNEVRSASFGGKRLVPEGAPEDDVVPLSIPLPPQRFYYCFGAPRSAADVDPADKEGCAALLASCRASLEADIALLLERRRADPCRGFFERMLAQRLLGWTELPELDLN